MRNLHGVEGTTQPTKVQSTGDSMTNDEYQRQAERSKPLDGARHRQGVEDFNRNQLEQAARDAQASPKAYSSTLGSMSALPPIFGPGVDRSTYGRAPQAREALQKSTSGSVSSHSSVTYGGRSVVTSSRKSKLGFGTLVILALIVGGLWLKFSKGKSADSVFTTTPTRTTSTLSSQSVVIHPAPKPSPYHYAQPREVAPNPVTPLAHSTVKPIVPKPIVPSSPLVRPAAWPPNGLQFLAEHKGVRHGCKDGVLTLAPSRLVFLCHTDQKKSLSLELSQVKGVDDDGIEASPSEKFHFKISGKSKEEVHRLFSDWIAGATAASATGSKGTR